MNHFRSIKYIIIPFAFILIIAAFSSCTNAKKGHLKAINSARQLGKITAKAKGRLLIIDFFDERCMSCFMLYAQLEEIAKEQKKNVSIYAINVSQNPELAKPFSIPGTPYVVYVKNGKVVHAIAGRQEKEEYVSAIEKYADWVIPRGIIYVPLQGKRFSLVDDCYNYVCPTGILHYFINKDGL